MELEEFATSPAGYVQGEFKPKRGRRYRTNYKTEKREGGSGETRTKGFITTLDRGGPK